MTKTDSTLDRNEDCLDVSERTTDSEAGDQEGYELTAATALTRLVQSPLAKAGGGESKDKMDFTFPQRYTRSGRKRAVSFPLKLMKVLSMKEYATVITWMPSGKSFNILNSRSFAAEILPEHFKSAKFSSFTRKLHRWGFIRHYRGEEAGAFFHKSFQKGRFDLVEKMTCHKQEPPKAVALPAPLPPMPTKQQPNPTAAVRAAPPTTAVVAPSRAEVPAQRSTAAAACLETNTAASTSTAAVDLNVAIELEVARRVRERLQEAALNRQALVLLQQQQEQKRLLQHQAEQQIIQQEQERQLLLRQAEQLKALAPALTTTTPLPWTQQGIAMLKRFAAASSENASEQRQQKPIVFPPRNFAAQVDTQPFPSLPPTNIYGAKTA